MSKASLYFTLNKIEGKRDIKTLKRELDRLQGVTSVAVNPQTEGIAIDFEGRSVKRTAIEKKVNDLGYEIVNSRYENHISY